jgi:hypothetical protein
MNELRVTFTPGTRESTGARGSSGTLGTPGAPGDLDDTGTSGGPGISRTSSGPSTSGLPDTSGTPQAGARYLARLTDAGGNPLGVEVPFTPLLDEGDYEDLRWYLEDYMDLPDGGAAVRAQRIEGRLDEWGRGLHDALFGAVWLEGLIRTIREAPH